MAGIELFQKMTLQDLARWLEVHPFDIIRVLIHDSSLPDDLRFNAPDVDRVRALGGIEAWWSDPPEDDGQGSYAASLAAELLAREIIGESASTRFDNLFRGLAPGLRAPVRAAAQSFLKDGLLVTCPTPTGMHVYIPRSRLASLENVIAGS